MKTPITDAVVASEDSLEHEGYVWIDPALARRLELDRAALMEALEEIHQESEMGSFAENKAWDALSSARANFPEP